MVQNKETGRQIDRQTDRQNYLADRLTDRQTYRQTDRQERRIEGEKNCRKRGKNTEKDRCVTYILGWSVLKRPVKIRGLL